MIDQAATSEETTLNRQSDSGSACNDLLCGHWLTRAIKRLRPAVARKRDLEAIERIVAEEASGCREDGKHIEEVVCMSFGGERHSGHMAVRGRRVVLRVWRNGSFFGDGDEQQIVIDADLLDSVLKAIEYGKRIQSA